MFLVSRHVSDIFMSCRTISRIFISVNRIFVSDKFVSCHSYLVPHYQICCIGFWRYLSCTSGTWNSERIFLFFDYVRKYRNKMTTILNIHLILLDIDVCLLVFKAFYFRGVYDTPRRGNVRKITNLTLNPSVIFCYLLKSPFGAKDGLLVWMIWKI